MTAGPNVNLSFKLINIKSFTYSKISIIFCVQTCTQVSKFINKESIFELSVMCTLNSRLYYNWFHNPCIILALFTKKLTRSSDMLTLSHMSVRR